MSLPTSGLVVVAALSWVPATASAQGQPIRSARGTMQVAARPVLGEKFCVALAASVPEGAALVFKDSNTLALAEKAKAPDVPGLRAVSVGKGVTGPCAAETVAPWYRPGVFDLVLVQGGKVVDAMALEVAVGTVADGIVPARRAYGPGEYIDVTVRLPPNRYYFGHWSGPSIRIVPVEIAGRRLSDTEALEAAEKLSAGTWLLNAVFVHGVRNLHDAGRAIRPGTYEFRMQELGEQGLVVNPLRAPDTPGRYELRLYDRGHTYPLSAYADLALASAEITVEARGMSPKTLRFLRTAPQPGTPGPPVSAEIRQLDYDEPFYLLALFDAGGGTEPQSRDVTFEWQGAATARETQSALVHRIGTGTYLGGPYVLVKPEAK